MNIENVNKLNLITVINTVDMYSVDIQECNITIFDTRCMSPFSASSAHCSKKG